MNCHYNQGNQFTPFSVDGQSLLQKRNAWKWTGFMAARNTFMNCNFHPTTASSFLTSILPYPATSYDAILTMIINFQDALKQKACTVGWWRFVLFDQGNSASETRPVFDLYPPQLTESLIQMAETFLARCLKPATDLETFDDVRYRSSATSWVFASKLLAQE